MSTIPVSTVGTWLASTLSQPCSSPLPVSLAYRGPTRLTSARLTELGLNATKITSQNFPLPTLGPALRELSQDIHNGRGFAVLRGLNPAEFSPGDLTMIFMGVSAYIGDKLGRQDRAGNCIVHIIADKANPSHHRHSTDPIVSLPPFPSPQRATHHHTWTSRTRRNR